MSRLFETREQREQRAEEYKLRAEKRLNLFELFLQLLITGFMIGFIIALIKFWFS